MEPIGGALCVICGERVLSPFAAANAAGGMSIRCGLCQRIEQPFERAVAYGSYDGGLRELIHLLKYASVRPATSILGRMLAEAISEIEPAFGGESIAVVPVPMYRGKLRQREFNQAEVIARSALKLFPADTRLQLQPEILKRKRETQSQTGLTRHQRRENVRGAFEVSNLDAVKGREILVVDDVYTTGATVSECARVLRRAGASKVWVATVARTLKNVEERLEIRESGEVGAEEQETILARAVVI